MSLNDYFAANGAVYLRPMGLPDCFTMPGLPHGIKPPPMPMQQQKPRSMAAVSPLHQGLPPPPSMGAYEGGGFGGAPSNNRTSSFAAALRKLAKQAVDPVAGEKDPTQISPVSSPSLSQGGPLTSKRTAPVNSGGAPPPPPPMFHQGASYGSSSSPPVVTIAPSRPVATHTSESRKVVDLSNVPTTNNPNPISNGHIQQESLKMDSSKGLPRHSEKWDESTLSSKGLSVSSASSQVRPHATIAPLPRPDDSVTSSRGFQPYRGGGSEESPRNTLPHHLSLFEHHHPSYPYAPAFLTPPHHLSHPAYRFDDPLYLERYSLLRPPMMPYAQPSMMGPPAAFYPNSRYAADLIAQSLSISSANNSMLNHERLKAEEQERRIREKELELKEQERQRDREHREKEHKEREKERRHSKDEQHYEHRKSNSSSSYSSSSKRTESPNVRTTPVIHSTPNHLPAPTIVSSSSSIPLNLVLPSGEPQRKETTELWMPWQQPANIHAKDANLEMGNNGAKHPAFRTQDTHRHHQARENHTNEKTNLRFSPSALMEKKQHIPTNDPMTIGDKKHSSDLMHRTPDNVPSHRTQQQDSIVPSSNRTPASYDAKDSAPHEWRHEKLQKACTNTHRKVHESKRASSQKDGLYQNHHHHHRKAVNGALLKPTTATAYPTEGMHPALYQNEGMHARLLESEKCRLEMNGHVIKTPGNAGLVVPSPYKSPSSGHYQKDLPQKSFADYFGSSGVLLKSSVEVPPVVSKLDIELRRLRKGEKICVDEEKEERRMRNLLIVAKMPQLKLDSNPHKLNFLRLFGLTTHLKKKKVEFDLFLKRRKRLRQDSSLLPTSFLKEETCRRDEEEDEDLVLEKRKNPVEVERLSERLRAEDDSPEKAEFLSMFGLKNFTLELREEKDRIRRKVSEEKSRRHYRLLATVNRKSSPKRLFVPKSEAAQRLDHLKKLNEMNAIPNGLISKRMDEDEETSDTKHTPTGQTVAPKMEQVPYTPSPECNPLGQPSDSSAAHKSLTKYSFKRGHSLKREFRFATPQSNHKSNHDVRLTNGVASSLLHPPSTPGAARCCSVGTQVDASADRCAAELKSTLSLSATIDTIMEVIYKNQTEQSSEKSVLSERCQQLRQTQDDLKKQADALSRQMSDLLRSKRELDEERQGYQKSIDLLKKCLQSGR